MATTTVTGSQTINDLTANAAEIPFSKYLTFGNLSSEDWNTQTYDSESSKVALSFKSSSGSTFKFANTKTGTDSNGGEKGSSAITSKLNGLNFSAVWADSWSDTLPNNPSSSSNVTWNYTGGTTTKNDDFNYKYVRTSKDNYAATSSGSQYGWTESKSIDFSNADYFFSGSYTSSSQSTYSYAISANVKDMDVCGS